jgi:hypothetical protein
MKMKKTFNLKLMLLGLMTLCSTNIWAQYTAVDGVVYGLSGDRKSATVKGVLSNLPADAKYGADLSIRIAGEVTIKTYGDGKTYTVPVTDFDEGWMHHGVYQCDPVSGSASTTQPTDPGLGDGSTFEQEIGGSTTTPTKRVTYRTVDADDVNGNDQVDQTLALVLASENLKEISRADIMADKSNVLPIAAFIVGSKSPITVIPDYLFAVCNTENVTHHYTYYGGTTTPQAALQKYTDDKTALEKLLNGDYVIKGGKFTDSKGVQHQVYKQLKDKNGSDVSAKNYYLYITETEAGTETVQGGQTVYTLMRINKDGTTTKLKVTARQGSAPNEDYLVNADFGDIEGRRVAVKFEGNAYMAGGYIAELTAKKAALEKLVKETIPQAEKDLRDAQFYKDNPDKYVTEAIIAKRDAAIRLEKAIAAFETTAPDKFKTLQAKIKGAISNVEEVTPWYAAFATATKLVSVGSWWDPLITEVKAAYEAFYGTTLVTIGDKVSAQAFTSKTARYANISEQTVDISTNTSLTLNDYTWTGKIQDLTDVERLNNIEGYRKIKFLESSNAELRNKICYVKGVEANQNKYYVVYTLPAGNTPGVRNLVPMKEGEDAILLNFATAEDYTLTRENLPTMDAADPDRDIAKAKKAAAPKDWDEEIANAQQALNDLNSDKTDLETRIKELEGDDVEDGLIEKAQLALNALPADPTQPESDAPVYTYSLNENEKNTTLKLVKFNNDVIEEFGDYAFYNCVNAEFVGTFPTATEYVGAKTFANTQITTADFSKAASEDLDISADAFKGTPLETLKLQGTTSAKINAALIKKIVASLVKTARDFTYTNLCGAEFTGVVQNTLATVTLPDALTSILPNTFQKCIALTAIKIPASVVTIGQYAFDGCVALVMNKESFAGAESELTTIGESAFRGTGAVLVWLKDIEGLNTIGDYAFADMCKLKTVNLLNTQVDHLYGHTFENDGDLYKVVFNEAMETLDEGLFSTNVLEDLNLANTQVQQLNDLFYAGPGIDPATHDVVRPAGMPNGVYNSYKEKHIMPNETLKTVELPTTGTLTHIKSFALQSLKKLENIVVPSSVKQMGWSVFMNDVALKSAKFEDTPMTGLQSHTFAQCLSLEEVIFTSVNGVVPSLFGADPRTPYVLGFEPIDYNWREGGYGFGDNLFFASNTAKTPEKTPMPVVTVSMDDYMALKGTKEYLEHYSTLKAALTTIELGGPIKYNGVDYYWKTFKSPYGTWIKAGKGVDVFTAYEDGDDVILYPAKIRGGYYKIAAYDPNGHYRISDATAAAGTDLHLGNDDASVCIIRSTSKTITATADYDESPLLIRNGDLKVQSTLDLENQLMAVQDDIWGNSATNFYVFGKKSDGTLTFKHITSDTYVIETGDICLMTTTDKGLESRNIVVVEPDEATAVQGVKEYLEGVKSGAIYNLQGVRVSTTQKGKMYIQGGKKFIQK